MKMRYRVFILSIILIVSFSCKGPVTELNSVINIDDAAALISKDQSVVVLDVRTPAEYAAGHIENAINIDINAKDFSERVALLDRDLTYIVHCAVNPSNGRSGKSLGIMGDLEFNRLLDLEGGIVAWQQSGHPLAASN